MSEPGGPGGGDDGQEPVGSVSEEALKLVGALSDWAREHGPDLGAGLSGFADHAAEAARGLDDHLATGAAECTWCPVCRAVHVVRQTSPEVRAHLAVAASSLLQAAAGFLATAVPEEARGRTAGVEHIDLEDDLHDPGVAGETAGDTDGDTDGDWPGRDDE